MTRKVLATFATCTFLLAAVFMLASCTGKPEESAEPTTPEKQVEPTQSQNEQPSGQPAAEDQSAGQKQPAEEAQPADEGQQTGTPTENEVKIDMPAADMIPLPLQLPQPMFVGTPQNIRVPGDKLEKPLGKPRPDFMVPKGVKNVALNKPVSASDEFPVIGEIEMLTDGDKEGADGSYVDLGPFHQYITIDLEDTYDIYAIVLWHFHKQARAYYDVVVQVSTDPDFTENVTTLFNNDHDNSIGLGAGDDYHYVETAEGKLIDAKGVKARYVRFHSNGNSSNDSNHYIEAEVYGKKPE